MDANWWRYDNLPSGEPYDWHEPDASRGDSEYDALDFHLDIGCGLAKKGRLGIDRFVGEGVDLVIDLETLQPMRLPVKYGRGRLFHRQTELQYDAEGLRSFTGQGEFRSFLPFPTGSIKSIISHHAMEHIGDGFVHLMDECHRVLEPGGLLRIITPLFPSTTAVEDPDHKRYFMENTFEAFCGTVTGGHWHESFSQPYTECRFQMVHKDISGRSDNPFDWWGQTDRREIRVALRKHAEEAGNGNDVGELQAGRETDPRDDDAVGRAAVAGGHHHLAGVSAKA